MTGGPTAGTTKVDQISPDGCDICRIVNQRLRWNKRAKTTGKRIESDESGARDACKKISSEFEIRTGELKRRGTTKVANLTKVTDVTEIEI